MELCTNRGARHAARRMVASRSRLSTLEVLRRSSRIAFFALILFVLRVGVVAACVDDDFAELFNGSDSAAHVVEAPEPAADEAASHSSGHCLHCACHHVVVVPASLTFGGSGSDSDRSSAPLQPHATPPPRLSLRPPIRL